MDERELIEKILRETPSKRKGDDAVPIEIGEKVLLVSVDGVSIASDMIPGSSPRDFGWYSCALSLSDIAACGGTPISILLSLTFNRELGEEFILEYVRGVEECASKFFTHLDGGDINEGKEFVADVVSVGIVEKGRYLPRSGARPGDLVFTTGPFGDQGAALHEALLGKRVPKKVLDKVIRPIPKIKEGEELAKTGLVSAMIDSSDGMYESLLELSKASGVLIEVELEKVPRGEWYSKRFPERLDFLLFGGGELELIFTASPEILDVDALGFEIYEIGRVLEGKGVRILNEGREIEAKGHGWRHFS